MFCLLHLLYLLFLSFGGCTLRLVGSFPGCINSMVCRYYVHFIDEFSRFSWIYFLRTKDEVVHVFSTFKAQVENLFDKKIKILQSDGGTELKPIAKAFPHIIHQTSCAYTPQQNGLAERKHRHIVD